MVKLVEGWNYMLYMLYKLCSGGLVEWWIGEMVEGEIAITGSKVNRACLLK